ncbi:MAG: AAA family ATPase [Actinomycetota bacterium]|nr:AAA family ATPase [Actinomycetota bacterium]
MSERETMTVTVRRVLFSSDDGSFSILDALDEGSGDDVAIVGPVGHLQPGHRAQVNGNWEEHARYGHQLRAADALPLDPTDREGQIAYLTSLRHIGEVRADTLVRIHGEAVLEEIAADPEGVFGELPGLGERQAAAAADSWHQSRAVRDLHVQLAPHGLAHLASLLHARHGADAMRVLHEEPYGLVEIDGVGFKLADRIALSTDVPPDSDRRAQAAASYALTEAERQGHTHLPLAELTREAAELLGTAADPEVLVSATGLTVDEDRVYREATHARELWCAEALAARAAAEPHVRHDPGTEPSGGLTNEQWEAVRGAFASRLSILTGGPGVGKTVCTRAIVEPARAAGAKVALCAPTGRAARRLEEATGHSAETIHRMLEWMPGSEPGHHPGHPHGADIVLVDEASMLNLQICEVLIAGLAETTHLVLVGDADQLPPIGAGKPFADLIESGIAPGTRLSHIFRQAALSMITTAAHAVNEGREPELEPGPDQDHDFFFLERPNPLHAVETITSLVAERVPDGLGLDPIRDVQVLAPMYRTAVGIDALNVGLQARLNPDGRPALKDRFRVGDRLIQTRNSHELGLMNGSICFLADDDPDEEAIVLETDEGASLVVPYDQANALKLGYAISVHKAQGSEVPVVVCVCHRSHSRMLSRPLIYTAITRAKRTCVLVGDRPALAIAVRRDDAGRRYSALAERLRQGSQE